MRLAPILPPPPPPPPRPPGRGRRDRGDGVDGDHLPALHPDHEGAGIPPTVPSPPSPHPITTTNTTTPSPPIKLNPADTTTRHRTTRSCTDMRSNPGAHRLSHRGRHRLRAEPTPTRMAMVRQLRHHFSPIWHVLLRSMPPHTRVVVCSAYRYGVCPCVSDADWCLRSDAVPDYRGPAHSGNGAGGGGGGGGGGGARRRRQTVLELIAQIQKEEVRDMKASPAPAPQPQCRVCHARA